MADEQGERWMLEKPGEDTIYYKVEVIDEADYVLPNGFELKEHLGTKYICKNGEEYTIITEKDGIIKLVGSEIVTLKKVDCK